MPFLNKEFIYFIKRLLTIYCYDELCNKECIRNSKIAEGNMQLGRNEVSEIKLHFVCVCFFI